MNSNKLKAAIMSGDFDKSFLRLYGQTEVPRERFSAAVDEFCALYGDAGDLRLFSAPGRTEIGGNHTDHQHGSVLAASVDLDVIAVVAKNNENTVRIKSKGYNMDEIDLSSLSKKESERGRAAALIRGVLFKFSQAGYDLGGFNAYTTSNVLKGSGLSSSAAFEVLVSNILNGLFCENKVDALSIAKYSQYAECEYFGKPCGLLDQMASSVGGFTYADFHDPQDPKVEQVNLDVREFGYTLSVVDTGGNHANLTADYAAITEECREISRALGVEFLRDANEQRFYDNMGTFRKKFGDRAVLRAFHFFNEQKRVELQRQALKDKDFEKFLYYVNESGESSYKYLQNLYSNSNVNEQGLSLAIALTKQFLKGKGACRVHGGGFAGTIQCYIPNDVFEDYKKMIEYVFGKGACVPLLVRPVGGCEVK
ncbi:MAG: galactokinase [Clostridia bacterium]|nr:galactokinase [Clostridia bacterium]